MNTRRLKNDGIGSRKDAAAGQISIQVYWQWQQLFAGFRGLVQALQPEAGFTDC